jgi:hypothetical protein
MFPNLCVLLGGTDMTRTSARRGNSVEDVKPDEKPTKWNHVAKHRRPRRLRQAAKPPLAIEQILAWADHEFRATGRWPKTIDGHVLVNRNEKWRNINAALMAGGRGLSGGTTLAQVLASYRGVRNRKGLPALRLKQVLASADAHRRRVGRWPNKDSGPIPELPGETWAAVDAALHNGCRGFPGGSSLAQVLDRERDVRNRKRLPPLSESQIIAWARRHRLSTGKWPSENAGPIEGTRGEVWENVAAALTQGIRGLPGGDSLARLLARRLGARNSAALPPLLEQDILSWADAYHARTGQWPRADSGAIAEAADETWSAVDSALRSGLRGMAGGSSLVKLLTLHRGVRNSRTPPALSVEKIIAWAEAHYRRVGRWPKGADGAIPEAPGETWNAVIIGLQRGARGLPRGETLHQLLRRSFTAR